MCNHRHRNFFHNCGHFQVVTIPSLNPNCNKERRTEAYVQDGHASNPPGGWCDRCYYGSWRSSLAYTIPLPPQQCCLLPPFQEGQTVVAEVTLLPAPFQTYRDVDWLWELRTEAAYEWGEYEHRHERAASERQLAEEAPNLGALGMPRMERTYFLKASPDLRDADYDLYEELAWDDLDVNAGEDVCGICKGGLKGLDPYGAFMKQEEEHKEPVRERDEEIRKGIVAEDGIMEVFTRQKNGLEGQLDADRCNATYAALMPCGHVFGLGCIRRWVEGSKQDTCPLCKARWKIVREQEIFPPGFEAQYARYLSLQKRPLEWHEGPLRHWQLNLALYILAMLALGCGVNPPRPPFWSNWWMILTLTAGTWEYYMALTAPIAQLSLSVMAKWAFVGHVLVYARRLSLGSGEVEWLGLVIMAIVGSLWLGGGDWIEWRRGVFLRLAFLLPFRIGVTNH